jgi:hypothetical protein
MKIAVINFSGNVGKTTVARHLLAPRLPGSQLISIESINAGEAQDHVIRGHQFAELQEFLQLSEDVIVDIGASNVEDLLGLMQRYHGSHEDFDAFVVPTAPPLKQQTDTIATLVDLARLGVSPSRVKLLFNMVSDDVPLATAFEPLASFVGHQDVATLNPDCRLGSNEVYARIKGTGMDLISLARDTTDFKAAIAQATDSQAKLTLAHRLATCRLARGVLPELDACFAALALGERQDTLQGDCAEAAA